MSAPDIAVTDEEIVDAIRRLGSFRAASRATGASMWYVQHVGKAAGLTGMAVNAPKKYRVDPEKAAQITERKKAFWGAA